MPIAFLIGISILLTIWDVPMQISKDVISHMGIFSYIAYVLLLTAAVVFMPLTVMPVIPFVANILGPLPTALLSIVGWTLGGAIAFLIARYLGRPVLEDVLHLHTLDSTMEKIPKETHFWFIVLLRLTLPVDLVSYALGLTKSVGFISYIAATILGVTWFSFMFAYLGEAFFAGNRAVLLELALASLFVFGISWYLLRRKDDK